MRRLLKPLLLLAAAAGVVLLFVKSAPADRVVPASARSAGRNGAFFQTDLRLLDTSQTQGAYVRLVFTPSNGGSPVTAPVVLLLPHEQKAFDNVLETLFGFTTDVSGPITVTA